MVREGSPWRRPAKLDAVLRSATRIYSNVSTLGKRRPNSAHGMPPISLDLIRDDTEAPPLAHSFFQHLHDSITAPPKLPPSILPTAGSVQHSVGGGSGPQSLTDIVLPAPSAAHQPVKKKFEQQPLPPPPRKASHPKMQRRHEDEPMTDGLRQRMAWDYIAAQRAVREAKERLKRLTAESVRRAKEAAAAKGRRDADDYRCLRTAEISKHVADGDVSPSLPNERRHEESQCAVPAEGAPPRKPPVPTMRRRRPLPKPSALHTNPEIDAASSTSSETQEEEVDEGTVVVTGESIVPVKVRLLSGVWIDLSCLGSSTVSHLKALLSLLTMESARPPVGTAPLLASEFVLRTTVGGAILENETLGTCVKRHGADLIMELSTLGSAVVSSMTQAHNQLHMAAAATAVVEKWAHRNTFAHRTLADRSSVHDSTRVAIDEIGPETAVADRIDLNRHVKTPAEIAKLTEDVRDANRCVKAQRARLLAKFQCSRQHRKIVEINRDIVNKQRACEAPCKSAPCSRFCRDGEPSLRYFERQFVPLCNLGKAKCSASTFSQVCNGNRHRLRRIQFADTRLREQDDSVVSIHDFRPIPRRWATVIDTIDIAKIHYSS